MVRSFRICRLPRDKRTKWTACQNFTHFRNINNIWLNKITIEMNFWSSTLSIIHLSIHICIFTQIYVYNFGEKHPIKCSVYQQPTTDNQSNLKYISQISTSFSVHFNWNKNCSNGYVSWFWSIWNIFIYVIQYEVWMCVCVIGIWWAKSLVWKAFSFQKYSNDFLIYKNRIYRKCAFIFISRDNIVMHLKFKPNPRAACVNWYDHWKPRESDVMSIIFIKYYITKNATVQKPIENTKILFKCCPKSNSLHDASS